MKTELLRHVRNPLYWTVLGGGLSVRAVLAWFDRRYRGGSFWARSVDYWNKFGSVTLAFLILLVLIRLFSMDRESGAWPVIQSTAHGRERLFRSRLLAGGAAVLCGAFLLAAGNLVLAAFLGRGLTRVQQGTALFLRSSLLAALGALGLFTAAALVCDALQNQPAAICACGIPFGISYFVNLSAVRPFEVFWFFRYGFFTELLRGRALQDHPVFWLLWYPLLLAGLLLLAVQKRKERKER